MSPTSRVVKPSSDASKSSHSTWDGRARCLQCGCPRANEFHTARVPTSVDSCVRLWIHLDRGCPTADLLQIAAHVFGGRQLRAAGRPPRHSGLLEDPPRAGVWPDSVQVFGGFALFWAAHPCAGVALFRYAAPGHRDEAWLKRGLPSS
jgi:hypothetical protein